MTIINFDSFTDSDHSISKIVSFKEILTQQISYDETFDFLSKKEQSDSIVIVDINEATIVLNLKGLELVNTEVLPAFMQIVQTSGVDFQRIVISNGSIDLSCWEEWLKNLLDSELKDKILAFKSLRLSPVQVEHLTQSSKSSQWPFRGYDFQDLDNLDEIFNFLDKSSHYTRLSLCRMNITDQKVTKLANVLMKAQNLVYLSMLHNPITDESAPVLVFLIQNRSKITTLNIGEFSLSNPVRISKVWRENIHRALQINIERGTKRKAVVAGEECYLKKNHGSTKDQREFLDRIFDINNGWEPYAREYYFRELLSNQFDIVQIPRDNHCFFHAVLRKMSAKYQDFEENLKKECIEHGIVRDQPQEILLRLLLVKYLEKNKAQYSEFSVNYEGHCDDMKGSVWASQVEIVGISNMLIEMGYNASVAVFDLKHKPKITEGGILAVQGLLEGKEGTDKIYLLHTPGHFDLLVEKTKLR